MKLKIITAFFLMFFSMTNAQNTANSSKVVILSLKSKPENVTITAIPVKTNNVKKTMDRNNLKKLEKDSLPTTIHLPKDAVMSNGYIEFDENEVFFKSKRPSDSLKD